MLTVKQVAVLKRTTRGAVLYAIEHGKIKARLVESAPKPYWLVDEASLVNWMPRSEKGKRK